MRLKVVIIWGNRQASVKGESARTVFKGCIQKFSGREKMSEPNLAGGNANKNVTVPATTDKNICIFLSSCISGRELQLRMRNRKKKGSL